MGNLSKSTRGALGWTQAQLAHVIGVHSLTVSKWEREQLKPSAYQEALLRNFQYATHCDPTIGDTASRMMAERGAVAALYTLLHASFGPRHGAEVARFR